MSDARIRVSGLTFSWPDGTPVFNELSFALGTSCIGLVAANGAGKSTLLQLLAGRLTPQGGTVSITGKPGYLPQRIVIDAQQSVADLLGVTDALYAVDRVLKGDANPILLERADGNWDLRDRINSALASLGLHQVTLLRQASTFSGGEILLLGLAAQLLRRPTVLFLDEPSNHLSAAARKRLYRVLAQFRGCLLVASHDRELLEQMDQIGELRPSELRMYGGGFSLYRAATDAEQSATDRQLQNLRKELRREQRERQQARERAEQRASNASRRLGSSGLPRIVAGNHARQAQVAAGKSATVHQARAQEVRSELKQAEQQAASLVPIRFSLPGTRVGPTQLVLACESLQACHEGRKLWGDAGVSLTIRGPERIAVLGDNGVGKTTLLQMLAGQRVPDGGTVRRGPGHLAYLDQRLDQLDPVLSIAENFARLALSLSMQARSDILARLGFRGRRMELPVGALSGGERLRATLACVLHADAAPQLLLLDEPTNNLDLETLRQLEQAIGSHEGALVVTSHDRNFLDSIGVTRRLELDSEGLRDAPA